MLKYRELRSDIYLLHNSKLEKIDMLWPMSQLRSNCTSPEIIGFLFVFGAEGIVRVVVKDAIRWRVFVKSISYELKFEFYSNTPFYRTIWGYGRRCSKSVNHSSIKNFDTDIFRANLIKPIQFLKFQDHLGFQNVQGQKFHCRQILF